MIRAIDVPGLATGAVSSTRCRTLDDGWALASAEPGAVAEPSDLEDDQLLRNWSPASVPGTVAQSAGPEGPGSLDRHDDYDDVDWWYRCSFSGPDAGADRIVLRLDGLATLAQVWLNGTEVLASASMFLRHRLDVTDLVGPDNELVIGFRSLNAELARRRPRPRWKTKLVDHQRLRWLRTSLLGRIPGWTPRIKPVGPWKGITLEVVDGIDCTRCSLRPSVEGTSGVVELDARFDTFDGTVVRSAVLTVGDTSAPVSVEPEESDGSLVVRGRLEVPEVQLWWPHTHGHPHCYDATLTLETSDGPVTVHVQPIGFRTVEIDRSDGRVRFVVNGVPVFARGACWTTNDIVSLTGDPSGVERTLSLAASANANMIRVGGTMVYETDEFYRLCDELGLMVWQDFMFANMDYPFDDPDFRDLAGREVRQQLDRLAAHPSVVAWCGGSEIEQQAAMFGADRTVWAHDFLTDELPQQVGERAPGTPYWPSTPTGGALPFHLSEGLGHYYGVGAYKRPLEDARLTRVKFSPECLGFSNVPEESSLNGLHSEGGIPAPHHPAWKAGVPRDSGAGWDFEDIRDHYLATLFGVDAVALRSEDPVRYRSLSRVVTGRVMSRVFDEWRSPEHPCGGGLVWFLQDLRPGAGWGLIDSENEPKPVWHYLRRAWDPVRLAFLDRGIEGLLIDVHNETPEPLDGSLSVQVIGRNGSPLAQSDVELHLPARGSVRRHVESDLGHFIDPTYAYRFGPRQHVVIVGRLDLDDGRVRRQECFWPTFTESLPAIRVEAETAGDGRSIEVTATGPARDVRLELSSGRSLDNYMDLIPAAGPLSADLVDEAPVRGYVAAENDPDGSRIAVPSPRE